MLKSLQISSKGLTAQMLKHEIVANNLSNVTTTGFKKELAKFSQEVTAGGGREVVVSSATHFAPAAIRRTDNPLDLAIEGDGFFVLETDDGERYTRSGSFVVGDDGTLLTPGGQALLGASGPIRVDVTQGEVSIAKDGSVTVGGEQSGTIRIVDFENPQSLIREGNAYRSPDRSAGDVEREAVAVMSGYLEESNVEALREMINMISALRAFQVMEKSIEASDEVLDVMINQVGRAPSGQ